MPQKQHYLLIDAATRSPVPLPFYGMAKNAGCEEPNAGFPVSVYDFIDPCENVPEGAVCGYVGPNAMRFRPGICGLVIVSEAEYMKGQQS